MAPIKIHGVTIDPEHPPEGLDLQDASDTNFILVQTTHPLNQEEFGKLQTCGAQVLNVVDANNTYHCRYEPQDLTVLEELYFVKHAIIYHQDFVLHSALKDVDPSQSLPFLKVVGSSDAREHLLCEVQIRLHESVPSGGDPFLTNLCQMLHEDFATMEISSHARSLQAFLPVDSLEHVAAMDQVMSITPTRSVVLDTLQARKVLEIDPGDQGLYPWYDDSQSIVDWDNRWNGFGEIVAVVDTGFNVGIGMTNDAHPAFNGCIANTVNSQTIVGDIVKDGKTITVRETQTLEDENSHGTLVAGCVVGSWNSSQNPADSQSSASNGMRGAAPRAKVFVQKGLRPSTDGLERWYSPLTTLKETQKASSKSVKIHNYSYGFDIGDAAVGGNQQEAYTEDMDNYTFATYDEELVVTSAGNSGTRMTFADTADAEKPEHWSNRQIDSYKASKNSLVIGSCWSTRQMDSYPHPQGTAGLLPRWSEVNTHEGDPDGMRKERYGVCGKEDPGAIALSSNKGPTLEGFLKPDLVGPGIGILSSYSLDPVAQGKKSGSKGFFSWSYNANYCRHKQMQFTSGTSFASPLVAGIAACVRSAALTKSSQLMLASTLRAILVNTAVSLKGRAFFYRVSDPTPNAPKRTTVKEGKLTDPPDCIQGFGLVSHRRSLIPVIQNPQREIEPGSTTGYGWTGYHQVDSRSPDCFTNANQTWPRQAVQNSDKDIQTLSSCIYWTDATNKQLRVTLAYADHPGPQLLYKLQLRVHPQIYENGSWTDVAGADRGPDDIQGYDYMDTWRAGNDRLVKYGTVQKVTFTNIAFAPKMRFQMRITALELNVAEYAPNPRVGFSLCWLASKNANF